MAIGGDGNPGNLRWWRVVFIEVRNKRSLWSHGFPSRGFVCLAMLGWGAN